MYYCTVHMQTTARDIRHSSLSQPRKGWCGRFRARMVTPRPLELAWPLALHSSQCPSLIPVSQVDVSLTSGALALGSGGECWSWPRTSG